LVENSRKITVQVEEIRHALIDVVYREGTQDDAMRLIDIAKQNLSSFKLIVRDVDMEYSILKANILSKFPPIPQRLVDQINESSKIVLN
jgi:hypothetical protein